jgi:hypothetical protein
MTEKEKIVLMALSAYTYDNVCDINIDNIKSTGLGKDSIRKITQKLELEGVIEIQTKNGFYPRFKMNTVLNCPKFLFDEILTLGNKETLVLALDKLDNFEKKPIKEVSKLLFGDSNRRSTIYKIKDNSKKTIFEHLAELEYVKLTPHNEKYPLLKTDFGLQIDNSEELIKSDYNCTRCGETNPNLMTSKSCCKKCATVERKARNRSSVEKFLHKKTLNSKNQKSRHITHNITELDIKDQLLLQNNKDYYSGELFSDIETMTVDRVDSSKGYEKGNIVITSYKCNCAKNDMSIDEFKELITQLYNNLENF